MSVAWPATLPSPQRPKVGIKEQRRAVKAVPVDGGPTRNRLTARHRVQQWTLVWYMTPAQMAIFRTFYEDDMEYGAVGFTTIPYAPSSGVVTPSEFKPLAPYKARPLGTGWEVSLPCVEVVAAF